MRRRREQRSDCGRLPGRSTPRCVGAGKGFTQAHSSALSQPDFRVNRLQFAAGVVDRTKCRFFPNFLVHCLTLLFSLGKLGSLREGFTD